MEQRIVKDFVVSQPLFFSFKVFKEIEPNISLLQFLCSIHIVLSSKNKNIILQFSNSYLELFHTLINEIIQFSRTDVLHLGKVIQNVCLRTPFWITLSDHLQRL